MCGIHIYIPKPFFICLQVFPIEKYRECLGAFWQVDGNEHISRISEIILGETKAYVLFERSHGDLHSYVRQKKRLREEEASRLFRQVVAAVAHCHENGIVLRDLKLRKFVFQDADKWVDVPCSLWICRALQCCFSSRASFFFFLSFGDVKQML